MAMTPSTPAAVAKGSPGPEAARGSLLAKPSVATSAWDSAAADRTSWAAVTGIATSHANDVQVRAVGRSREAVRE